MSPEIHLFKYGNQYTFLFSVRIKNVDKTADTGRFLEPQSNVWEPWRPRFLSWTLASLSGAERGLGKHEKV